MSKVIVGMTVLGLAVAGTTVASAAFTQSPSVSPSAAAKHNSALTRNSVGSWQVVDGSLKYRDFSRVTIARLRGAEGKAGAAGARGTAGIRGVAGSAGSAGARGIAGTAGRAGIDGTAGTAGRAGIDGTAGTAGRAGIDGTAGTAGRAGTDGAPGAAGAIGPRGPIEFVQFYALMPSDNALTVGAGAAVEFSQDGPTSGTITRSNDSIFTLPAIGTYDVSFQVSITEAGQLMLKLNSAELGYTVVGRATGASQITGHFLVTTTRANSVLSVVNPTGNTTLAITPRAGGTRPVSASLLITQIA